MRGEDRNAFGWVIGRRWPGRIGWRLRLHIETRHEALMKALLTEGHTSDFMLLPLPRRVVCVNASWTVLSVLRWNECYSTESLGKYCSLGGQL